MSDKCVPRGTVEETSNVRVFLQIMVLTENSETNMNTAMKVMVC